MNRVVVVQKSLPPYRVEFFRRLRAVLADRGWDLAVVYSGDPGTAPADGNDAILFRALPPAARIPLAIGGVRETFILPKGLPALLEALCPRVVVCGDVNDLPSGLVCRRHAVRHGVPYFVWGLGRIPGKKRSLLRTVLRPLIRSFHEDASGFLAYSDFAATHYRTMTGRRVYPVYNSCVRAPDVREREKLLVRIEGKYRDGGRPLHVIFIGALTPQKNVSVLLRALARLGNENVRFDLVGDGPLRRDLEEESVRLGIEGRVTFHGDVRDEERKRELFDSAHIGVLPGLGGLALQELYARGVPVICSYADGTELDLVRGPLPRFFLEHMDRDSLTEAITSFIEMTPADQIGTAIVALSVVEAKYNLDAMADRFAEAVVSHADNA